MSGQEVDGRERVGQEWVFLHSCVKAEIAGELATALYLMAIEAKPVDRIEAFHPVHCFERTVEDTVERDPRVLTEESRRKEWDSRAPLY